MKPDAIAQALAAAIEEASASRFEVRSMEPVHGGCIHSAFKLSGEIPGGKRRYFAKVNHAEKAQLLACEAEGLRALGEAHALAVPEVVAQGHDLERAWLVLEWLDLAPLDAKSGARLGAALAAQHRLPQARFGWTRDNFIGATAQLNGWADDWAEFWRAQRLHAQLRLAAHHRLPSRMIDRGERLTADCELFFRNYHPEKSLLHGDLWGGNAAACQDGKAVAFDPAVYVGDREADLAMTELFGGFPPDFHAAYRAAWPLDEGYRGRRELYNLYHLLNHANLFAGGYVRQAEQAIERLLAEIG
ncbi:MAG TPA: fructosamine kinase family protein [Usitatibacter sp.]|nr:fructosamine kinase family protein [Usitatibacter sp.]